VLLPLFPIADKRTVDAVVEGIVSRRRTNVGDTLVILPFRAALGETDSVVISLNNITYSPCANVQPEVTIPISIAGICRANGIPRFITARASRLTILGVKGGTEHTPLEVIAAGQDVGMAHAQLWSILGEVIPLQLTISEGSTATWICTSPISSGSYVLVVRTAQNAVQTPVHIIR
jgi:hypothetical protein